MAPSLFLFIHLCLPPSFSLSGNYYGTPKPPAEPNLVQPDLVDQVLFDEDFSGEVPRKRTTSVSKMDRKDSAVPEEEDDDERPPLLNGLPGQFHFQAQRVILNNRGSAAPCVQYHVGFPGELNVTVCPSACKDVETFACFRLQTE